MSQALVDLPPNLTPAQLATVLEDRIRDLNQILATVVSTPSTSPVDMGSNRIINLADPQADTDAVTFRTLKRFQGAAASSIPAPISAPGAVTFRLEMRGFGGLDFEDVTVAGAADSVDFIAFAVDETDPQLSGPIGVALPATVTVDPTTIANQNGVIGGVATKPMGRLNRSVGIGDFLLIEGEIVKVAGVDPSNLTIKRKGPGPSTAAWLGSTIAPHGTAAVWFKLIPFYFSANARPGTYGMPSQIVPLGAKAAVSTSRVPSRDSFELPNVCVVAIAAAARAGSLSGPVTIANYYQGLTKVVGVTNFGTSPGLRTLSGDAYSDLGVSGKLTAGGFADILGRVHAWHSLRNAYAFLMTPGVATAYLLYYTPARDHGGIVQQFNFKTGSALSGPTATDGQQMPFGPMLQVWPPTQFSRIAMTAGRATYPLKYAGRDSIPLLMDGWWDLLVTAADGTAADLACVIQV